MIGRKFLEREPCGVCFDSKSCLKIESEMRVCPAKAEWGGCFINHFYSLVLITEHWQSELFQQSVRMGLLGFFFILFLLLLIDLSFGIQKCSVISGCLVR